MKDRKVHHYNDGCMSKVYDDGRWELMLPNGQHVKGIQSNRLTAQAAVNQAHDNYVIGQWAKGTLIGHGRIECPLS
jgi:hypothetical protein